MVLQGHDEFSQVLIALDAPEAFVGHEQCRGTTAHHHLRIRPSFDPARQASTLAGRCFQVVVGCASRQSRVFPRAAHGEMVKALECVVRESHQFMNGIVQSCSRRREEADFYSEFQSAWLQTNPPPYVSGYGFF